MVPEIFTDGKERQNGSIEVPHSYYYPNLGIEFRADGWQFNFKIKQVEAFLKDLAEHTKLYQPLTKEQESTYVDQLVRQLRDETPEVDSVSARFTYEELLGISQKHNTERGLVTLRFANQEALNKTFLDLLPFNRFHKNSPDPYDIYSDGVRLAKLLSALGVLDKPTLSYIEEQMPSLKHPDPNNWDNSGNPRRIVSVAWDQLPSAKSYG